MSHYLKSLADNLKNDYPDCTYRKVSKDVHLNEYLTVKEDSAGVFTLNYRTGLSIYDWPRAKSMENWLLNISKYLSGDIINLYPASAYPGQYVMVVSDDSNLRGAVFYISHKYGNNIVIRDVLTNSIESEVSPRDVLRLIPKAVPDLPITTDSASIISSLSQLLEPSEGLKSVDYLRSVVSFLNNRPEFVNEDKSVIDLILEYSNYE